MPFRLFPPRTPRPQSVVRNQVRLARNCQIAWLLCTAAACGGDGLLTPVLTAEIEAEARRLEAIADSAERGAGPRLSVDLRHIAQVVRLSRGLSPVSVSVDGVATPFHAITELFFTEWPTFPAESLATGAHLHLWQRPRAELVLTLFSPSAGNYAITSPFAVLPVVSATGELLDRDGNRWQTASGSVAGKVLQLFGDCESPRPPRDQLGFGCRQALFRHAIDAVVTASILVPATQAASRRLVMGASDVEGVLLPGIAVLPSPSSRRQIRGRHNASSSPSVPPVKLRRK
ncbi:MAG: hypothetical protein ACR2G6_11030 [Gemmatimonadaceae bacterium]